MTKDEALKLALEALTEFSEIAQQDPTFSMKPAAFELMGTIRAILQTKEPAQKPAGYWQGEFSKDGGATLYEVPQESVFGRKYLNIPLYTTPPAAPAQEPVALKPCWYESKEKTMCRKCGQVHAEAIITAAPVRESLSELEKDAANLLFALHDAWPYVHERCTIESKKKSIQALMVKHGDFADLHPPKALRLTGWVDWR